VLWLPSAADKRVVHSNCLLLVCRGVVDELSPSPRCGFRKRAGCPQEEVYSPGGLPVRGVKTILQRWSVLQINCAAGYASSHPAVRSGRDADTEPWPAIHAPELKPLKPLPVLLLSLLAGVLQPMLYSISSVDLTQSPPQRAFFVQKKTSGAY
jgi:hypothetical protein